MTDYTPEQIQRIRLAIAAGREAMRDAGQFQPLIFARAFVAAGGFQLPGRVDDPATAGLAQELLKRLTDGGATDNPLLKRELARAHAESRWAEAAEVDAVVGFRLELAPAALLDRNCREILKTDHGLGSAVFRKAEIVVLPAACDGAQFTPVYEHEVEQ